MPTVTLDTVYRSSDEEHLLFLNRIRYQQPDKDTLRQYFDDRHWRCGLVEAVAHGMELAKAKNEVFRWLCTTNNGASQVCEAALEDLGISKADLDTGYPCDPSTKSDLPILARKGILLRLSRNFDKQRGFVNGAMVEVCESLAGNAVFMARLIGTGNMVLVHPMEEEGCSIN